MNLAITIDTEEDDWGDYRTSGQRVENARRIPRLQRLFEEFGVIPTYLVTYSIAADDAARSILRPIAEAGGCEIGAHCHPWNTPPIAAARVPARDSMLCNLPVDVQIAKMRCLHETLQNAFGQPPTSFRCGRWGFGREIASHLIDLGYTIDSSVTPYMDWTSSDGPNFSNIPPRPYLLAVSGASNNAAGRPLLEVPVTIGFLRSCFALSNAILRSASRPPLKQLRVTGILDRFNLVSKVWLSPEESTAEQMIALTKRVLEQNCEILNLTFHSPSLLAGATPFVRTKSDEDQFLDRLRRYLMFVRESGIRSIKLSDAVALV